MVSWSSGGYFAAYNYKILKTIKMLKRVYDEVAQGIWKKKDWYRIAASYCK